MEYKLNVKVLKQKSIFLTPKINITLRLINISDRFGVIHTWHKTSNNEFIHEEVKLCAKYNKAYKFFHDTVREYKKIAIDNKRK